MDKKSYIFFPLYLYVHLFSELLIRISLVVKNLIVSQNLNIKFCLTESLS